MSIEAIMLKLQIDPSITNLSWLCEYILDCIENEHHSALCSLMRDTNLTLYDPATIVGILRYSSPIKEKIGEWNAYLDRVRIELLRRGRKDVDDVLRGLKHV